MHNSNVYESLKLKYDAAKKNPVILAWDEAHAIMESLLALDAAWESMSTCDDIKLNQSLNQAIADLQAARALAEENAELARFCLQGLLDVLSGKNREFAKLLVEFGRRNMLCKCTGARTATNGVCDACHAPADWAK